MNPPTVAISGASGYVGSVIAAALRPVANVVCVNRVRKADEDIVWALDDPVDTLQAALRQRGVECLIHAAWDMHASRQADVKRICVDGSLCLLKAAEMANVSKIIFISTISAFASAKSIYGRSKLEVEEQVLRRHGVVLRLGLVYGDGEGGVFGNIRKTVRNASIIPMIGDGQALQYLLHEKTLAEVIQRTVQGEFADAGEALTVANPNGITFRDLVSYAASVQGLKIIMIGLPWRFLYFGLRMAEIFGLKLKFRSDSVISFISQNPNPDFSLLRRYRISPVPLTR